MEDSCNWAKLAIKLGKAYELLYHCLYLGKDLGCLCLSLCWLKSLG
jgi:hypothetical protein